MAKTAKGKSEESISPVEVEQPGETDSLRAQPAQDEIAVRAYHIYLERGGAVGNPEDDWLQAERELMEADS